MAKYTSDTNLTRGAATAYKNYDNTPGMYTGLDKAIKAGADMADTSIKEHKAEQERIKKEAAAEKKKKKDQDNAWYDVAGKTYEAAGSFMKADGPELADTIALLDELQPEYTRAMENGSAAEKAAVVGRYNDIKANVNGHKKLRADISDGLIGASEANFNAGTLVGDDGRFGDFLTGLLEEDYKITYKDNEDGVEQKMYTVGDTSYTLDQISKKTVRKDAVPAQKFYKALDALGAKGQEYNDGKARRAVDSVIPSGYNETREFMRGKNFAGKNIGEVMSLPENRADIEATINKQLFDSGSGEGSIKGDGIIQEGEFANFLSAATDPYHPMWNTGGKVDKQGWEKSSRAIATELLVNSIRNEQVKNNPEDPMWKQKGYANEGAYLKAEGITDTLDGGGQQDVWAGVNGRMYNPATDNDEYVGRKEEGGKLTEYGAYNYDSNNKLLEANKSFPDMFGNIYEPDIVHRGGRVIKWKIKKAGSGKYIETKDGKAKQYSTAEVRKNAFGGNYKSPTNIG